MAAGLSDTHIAIMCGTAARELSDLAAGCSNAIKPEDRPMSLILLILIILIVFGGIGSFATGGFGYGNYGHGGIGLILVIVLIVFLLGGRF